MKKSSLYVFAIALTLGITASVLTGAATQGTQSASSEVNRANNAAFRDGLYVGKLDAAQGNRPHLSSGRWSADTDRRAYVIGYQKGYNQFLQTGTTAVPAPQMAELNGYRDGMTDGANDRRAARPFQLSKTDNFKNAVTDLVDVATDQERSRQAYRQAYANGYQEAYYGRDHANANQAGELSSSL